jgi:arylsulfatase A-like enzyme
MLRNRFVLVAPAVLVAVLVVLLQLPASASHSASHPCDLIASTEGSDSNSGTDIESPLRNVQTLVDSLAPGQTGCLRATEAAAPFVENVVVANKNASGGNESDRITIRGYPGEVAKLRGHLTIEDTANRISLKQLVLEGTPGGAAVRLDGDDVVLADSNVTHTGAACVRVGVMSLAQRTQILRNRIHDCSSDGVNLGQTLYTTVRANLLYDSGGTGVKLTADADASYVYRNVIDRNGQGVMFYGATTTRFADSNFVDSSVITRSTAGWNVGYTQMPGAAGNFLSQVCAYSPKNPNGGLQSNQQPQGYQVWGPAPHIGDPNYRDSVNGDFSPSDPANACFQHSGDVNAAVKQGGGANDEEASADNSKPNILFVVTDDQRADGTMIPEAMPQTLARLVDQGVNFTNAFATTPLCCPARASIMTGQYAHNHEVTNGSWAEDLNQDTTLQAYLKQVGSGYRTGLFGKFLNGWNLDVDPPHWDKFAIFNDGYCPFVVNENGDRKRYPPIDPSTGGPPAGECAAADIGRTPLAPYTTDYVRDQALDFLEQGETDDTTDSKPWFMYVAPYAPHTPFEPEADYANLSMPPFTNTPATFEDTSDKPSWVTERATTPESVFGDGSNPGRRVQQLRTLRSVDDMVGTLLDQLQDKGEQDTLVVFLSDNGYLWGDHGLTEKGAPYGAGAKVPMVMRYAPFTTPGKTDTRTVANIDLMPTALQLAGVPPPVNPQVDGQSLIGPTTPRQRIHNEFYDHGPGDVDWASTRVPGDYFYIETYGDDGETIDFLEYYDLDADPYETTNLYGPDGIPDTGDDLGTPEHAVVDLHDQLRRDRLCEGTDCPPGPGGGTVDTRPPRTLITAPSTGSTVCCRVMLKAEASDNIGVDRVEFRIDGNLIGTDTDEPFRMIWEDTNLYAAGPHNIEAIAVDGSGERTVSGSPGSSINVNLSQTGFDVQIDDGGVPRTSCGAQAPPCNVGTINPGDKVKFTFPSPVAPGTLIPGWDGTKPATCSGDPPSLGCVTMGLKADSQVDQFDNDTGAIYSDLAAMNKILPLGDFDLADFDYIPFDTGIPLRTWPRSAMELTNSNKTVVITLGSGTGSLGDGEVGTVAWTNPACNCKVWESIDGADTGEDREF